MMYHVQQMTKLNKFLKKKAKNCSKIFTIANHVPIDGLCNWINELINVWLNINLKRSWRFVIYVWGNDSFLGAVNGYVPYWR